MRISLLFLMCFWALEICPFCAQAGAKGMMINGIEFNAKSIQKPAAHMDGLGSPFSPASLDTLFSFPAPGNFPAGLAWDGQYIWHSDYNLDTVYKMTTAGSIVSSFPFFQSGGDMTWDGNNLWMVDEQMALLYKIDPTTGTVIDQFDLPSSGQIDPNGWGIAWDGQYLWHSEYATTAMIYKLDPQNAQVIDSFPPPENFILGIEWVGSFLYGVSTTGHTLYKFDPATGAVLDTETWPAGFALGPHGTDNIFGMWIIAINESIK
jgi:DNA-binding beta-propeller fold protein YncE